MAHCRSPTKCLKNDHFPSNQIQIVPDSNCCKLFMGNRLPAGTNFSPDTSERNSLSSLFLANASMGLVWLGSSLSGIWHPSGHRGSNFYFLAFQQSSRDATIY